MEKTILTQTQVDELVAKSYALAEKIDRLQDNLLKNSEKADHCDENNYGDTNVDTIDEIIKAVGEKAQFDDVLTNYEIATPPESNTIDIGSLVTYIILKNEGVSERLVGQEKTIMVVQKNYSNARPKEFTYVSLDTEAGRAFFGTKRGDVVSYVANGKTFKTLVTGVDNNFSFQPQKQKTIAK